MYIIDADMDITIFHGVLERDCGQMAHSRRFSLVSQQSDVEQ